MIAPPASPIPTDGAPPTFTPSSKSSKLTALTSAPAPKASTRPISRDGHDRARPSSIPSTSDEAATNPQPNAAPMRPTLLGCRSSSIVSLVADWNQKVIDEFRANAGQVGGTFEGRTLLLLHHRGAKTGTERVNPVAYQRLSDGSVAVFASKGGAPTNPDWYRNVVANPDVTVELGTETFPATARVAEGAERDEIWERQKRDWPGLPSTKRRRGGFERSPWSSSKRRGPRPRALLDGRAGDLAAALCPQDRADHDDGDDTAASVTLSPRNTAAMTHQGMERDAERCWPRRCGCEGHA